MITYDIYPIPYEVRGLEYLNLLHKHVQERIEQGVAFRIKKFSWRLLFEIPRENERRIVHIHWETNIYGSKYLLLSLLRMFYRFLGLWLIKLRGIKIVWTMHNLRAHDYPHPAIDRLGRSIMRHLADAIIIQEKNFALEESKRHPKVHIVFIPQGNYVDVYGPLWWGDRDALRKSYGFNSNDIVLLALGSIRPYKALPSLIAAVSEAHLKNVSVQLLIAGKVNEEYLQVITRLVSGNSAVILRPGFVPDEEIPRILAAADHSLFYYEDSSLNSAAMMLSLSYGTPVITRDIPASEIITNKNGLVFHTAQELKNILSNLTPVSSSDRNAIIDTVAHQDWRTVASELRHTYHGLF